MFDLPTWFWNTLAITVFIVVNIILWFHFRRCKAKGIKPNPPFDRFKKHEKLISRWTDIFAIAVILLGTIACGFVIFGITIDRPANLPLEYQQADFRLTLSVVFLFLLIYSTLVTLMASSLSPFQNNITFKKRLILFVMCCIPLVFGILYRIFDNSQDYHVYLKLLVGGLFPIVFINWPAIFLGRSFFEFYPALFRKIPLPYFQIPEPKEPEEK